MSSLLGSVEKGLFRVWDIDFRVEDGLEIGIRDFSC